MTARFNADLVEGQIRLASGAPCVTDHCSAILIYLETARPYPLRPY
jgi:hypothetical protein